MNIIVVGQFYHEAFAQHISETLVAMGHRVHNLEAKRTFSKFSKRNYYLRMMNNIITDLYSKSPFYEKYLLKRINRLLQSADFDLIIACHDYLTHNQLQAIREISKCKICLWFPDGLHNFGKAMFVNAEYDHYFFKDPYIIDILQSDYGISNAHYLPECCNPGYHTKTDISEADRKKYECDITTAGNLHSFRLQFFTHLKNYHVKIWGNPAPRWMNTAHIEGMLMNEYVSNLSKSKAFQCAKIVVNNLYPGEIIGTNVRTFEIAATGAFQLVNYRPGLSTLYEEGKEIVSFKSIPELLDHVKYYMANPEIRQSIGEHARQRTLREHTYENRLKQLISIVTDN